jgi:hypothetical protein
MTIERRDGYWLWTNGPVPRGSTAITIGRLVIVRRREISPRLLRHELVHVRQFGNQGFIPFLARYVFSYLRWRLHGYPHRGAYRRIPHEIEAYWLERQHR